MESLSSLLGPCQKISLALGESEDETGSEVKKLERLHITPTVWDESLREGGLILSEQTNIALNKLRELHGKEEGAWGIYLQCDEVFHEDDYELIKEDIEKAQNSGCDVMTFRYLHFWQSHDKIAINKKWYPQEIRAVKLDSNIESWGDAQSFRNHTKVYESEARIFHYGHVREEDKYKSKKKDILKLYHLDEKLKKYTNREKRFDNQTETLSYFGPHPSLMEKRMQRIGFHKKPATKESVWIVADESRFSTGLIEKINAKEVNFCRQLNEVPHEQRADAILMEPSFLENIFYRSRVPISMRSPLARKWSDDFILTLKLSEKEISVGN